MTGCVAIGCTNRSEQGYGMKRFPKDKTRRKIWAAKVNRNRWKPNNSSYLCQVHFESIMWEKTRANGIKKLKADAIPTLFNHRPVPKRRKPPKERYNEKDNLCQRVKQLLTEHNYFLNIDIRNNRTVSNKIAGAHKLSETEPISMKFQTSSRGRKIPQSVAALNKDTELMKTNRAISLLKKQLKELRAEKMQLSLKYKKL